MRKYERRRSDEGKDNRGRKSGAYVCVIKDKMSSQARKDEENTPKHEQFVIPQLLQGTADCIEFRIRFKFGLRAVLRMNRRCITAHRWGLRVSLSDYTGGFSVCVHVFAS